MQIITHLKKKNKIVCKPCSSGGTTHHNHILMSVWAKGALTIEVMRQGGKQDQGVWGGALCGTSDL